MRPAGPGELYAKAVESAGRAEVGTDRRGGQPHIEDARASFTPDLTDASRVALLLMIACSSSIRPASLRVFLRRLSASTRPDDRTKDRHQDRMKKKPKPAAVAGSDREGTDPLADAGSAAHDRSAGMPRRPRRSGCPRPDTGRGWGCHLRHLPPRIGWFSHASVPLDRPARSACKHAAAAPGQSRSDLSTRRTRRAALSILRDPASSYTPTRQ